MDRPTEADFDHAIEVGFLPGVTDNIGTRARLTIEDYFGYQLRWCAGEYSYQVTGGTFSRDKLMRVVESIAM